jgi:hypothetical protein
MGITAVRRTGAFFVILSLVASVFVVVAPAAFSQGALASVTVGACENDQATVEVELEGDGTLAFLVRDAANVEVAGSFTNAASHTFPVPAGSYQWIVFATSDPQKTPIQSGAFTVDCTEETTTTTVPVETTTTVPMETTTTVPVETTTTVPVETTTTVPETPSTSTPAQTTIATVPTTSAPEVNPTSTVQQTSTTVAPVTASTLPFTGVEAGEMAVMAALAMIGGLGMVLLAGRRGDDENDTGALGRW